MTDSTPVAASAPIRKPSPPARKPSAKTLARSLAVYLKTNNIKGDTTVTALMDRIKSSIVVEEVGVSLDGWES